MGLPYADVCINASTPVVGAGAGAEIPPPGIPLGPTPPVVVPVIDIFGADIIDGGGGGAFDLGTRPGTTHWFKSLSKYGLFASSISCAFKSTLLASPTGIKLDITLPNQEVLSFFIVGLGALSLLYINI